MVSPPPRPPLMEPRALQSVVWDDVSGCLVYPIPPWRHRLRSACAVFLPSPSAERLRVRLILPYASRPLQSISSHCPPGADVRAAFPGLPSLIAVPTAESTHTGIPSPLRSVLDVSHVLDGLLLHSLRGFVSPRNHVQGSPFRGFPRREAARARRSPLPSCRCSRSLPSVSQWLRDHSLAYRALLLSPIRRNTPAV
jgi:hypothetical protein